MPHESSPPNDVRENMEVFAPSCVDFFYLGLKGHFKFIPDELYVRICYRILMGKRLELAPPRTFNEKLQRLKLHDRRPEQTRWVDKYEVRRLIAATVGEDHLFPLLGVWDRVEDV